MPPFSDLLWPQGKDNMGGLLGELYYIPTEDLDESQLPTLDVDGVTLTGDFVPKTDKKFFRIYCTRGTGVLQDNSVGERDGKSHENLVDFFIPGAVKNVESFKRRVQNTPCVIVCSDTDGNFRVLGVAALGDEGSESVSLAMPAYLESKTGTTGAAGTDRRGSTFQFKSEAPHPPLFYDGTIPLTPAV